MHAKSKFQTNAFQLASNVFLFIKLIKNVLVLAKLFILANTFISSNYLFYSIF